MRKKYFAADEKRGRLKAWLDTFRRPLSVIWQITLQTIII
ncbi:hypothetical protein NEIELOOT_00800 [Neisseria elongata subsp. glycolytica ATCC 29315]|uniref:Uncharacterized protein n=1 Tax=Neisseria elongata subsp. glycolytica ATCC 29315 TaxID=546263 RepID=D4DP15_NEIEG|nr:hypothetical protein NEIELOOT_00800 [Neisseria elongata subsp. glycolytica ATCC 29315]